MFQPQQTFHWVWIRCNHIFGLCQLVAYLWDSMLIHFQEGFDWFCLIFLQFPWPQSIREVCAGKLGQHRKQWVLIELLLWTQPPPAVAQKHSACPKWFFQFAEKDVDVWNQPNTKLSLRSTSFWLRDLEKMIRVSEAQFPPLNNETNKIYSASFMWRFSAWHIPHDHRVIFLKR